MKNKKLKAVLSITGYFLLVIALCISASIVFHNTYYESVYISGSSMSPTLTGSVISTYSYGVEIEEEGSIVDFGIVDNHQSAINNIKRFSIISTYYPDDYGLDGELLDSSSEKIKRVIGLPGDTFKIEDSKLFVKENDEYKNIPYTFDIEPSVDSLYNGKDHDEITLGEDEYWVLGDHRDKSHDCGSSDINRPIKKSYICGVLIAIEGQAKIKLKAGKCSVCHEPFTSGVKCSKCGAYLPREFELIDKEYHWPKYF